MIVRLALMLLLVPACGDTDPCAGVRDLATSPGGLALTRDEHALGWGHAECFQCHQAWAIHRADCSSFEDTGALVDLTAITDRIDVDDTTTCAPCHGANGIAGWDALLEDDESITGEEGR